MAQIRLGQVLLIVCCIFYLIWWSVAFHPSHGNSHASGIDGILLMITAAFGLAGLAVNLIGIRDNVSGNGFISGIIIIGAGIAAYVVIMFLTSTFLHRQVTTELMLIIGWAMLEIASVNTACALEHISWNKVVLFLFIVAVAAISSLVFYLLYYRVEPMLGYYLGMVPLVTEALGMGVFLLLSKYN